MPQSIVWNHTMRRMKRSIAAALALLVLLVSCTPKQSSSSEHPQPATPTTQPSVRTSSIVTPPPPRPTTTQVLSRAEWGAPLVDVTRDGDNWVIAGKRQRVTLNPHDLSMTVRADDTTWSMVASGKNDMIVRLREVDFPVRLADAHDVKIEPYDTG
jgi:hypothetical protein